MEPRLQTIDLPHPGGRHRLSWVEWGAPDAARTVVCVHGLTRNARDFDALAPALAAGGARVLCPDMPGRGRSDWLPDPALYAYPQYAADMGGLLAAVAPGAVDWVGTSMGGLLGMMMAAAEGSRVRRLVLNDVGPFVPAAALERIGRYVGQDPAFPDLAAVERHLRTIHAPFGPLSDAEWQAMVRHGHRVRPDGSLALGYDPAIARPFQAGKLADVDLWPFWRRIACPVLVIRGANSDLLSRETVVRMVADKPGTETLEVPGVGHAPALNTPLQIDAIRRFLEAP